MTRLLNYSDEGRCLTHVAVSGRQATAVSQAGVPGRIQTFRTRDAIRSGVSADWPIPAGISLFGEDMQWLNTEFVVVRGPWTMQSEYLVSTLHDARTTFAGTPDATTTYHGGYVQLFRFLTDDYDSYSKERGAFDRVKPLHSFRAPIGPEENGCRGIGAVQVGARYNYLDLNYSGFNAGILHNATFGVNWFMNPNMKLQANYFFTYRDVSETLNFPDGSGWIHGWGSRIAIDF
jgi:phosphate-selective porin OprO/OprP